MQQIILICTAPTTTASLTRSTYEFSGSDTGSKNAAARLRHIFDIKEYQARYPDVSELSPEKTLYQYVTQGQAERRLGRRDWADPLEWDALFDHWQQSVVTAGPNDLVRTFTAFNGKGLVGHRR